MKNETVTPADKIWEEIKNVGLDIFSLTNKCVADYGTPVPVDPTRLFLTTKVGAFLPALEVALSKKYSVEKVDKYIVVAPKAAVETSKYVTINSNVVVSDK